jgi:hypothetical protein
MSQNKLNKLTTKSFYSMEGLSCMYLIKLYNWHDSVFTMHKWQDRMFQNQADFLCIIKPITVS